MEGEESVAGRGVGSKAVKCNGKYRIAGGGAPFAVGDVGFFEKIAFNEGCLAGGEDLVADEGEGDLFSVEVDVVADRRGLDGAEPMEIADVSGFILMKSFSANKTNQEIITNVIHNLAFIKIHRNFRKYTDIHKLEFQSLKIDQKC